MLGLIIIHSFIDHETDFISSFIHISKTTKIFKNLLIKNEIKNEIKVNAKQQMFFIAKFR